MQAMGGRGVALVIGGIMLLQAAWMVTVPPFRGIDEIDHVYRASAVAGGEWVAGERATDGRGWLVKVRASLVAAAEPQCEELDYYGPDNCVPVATTSDGDVLVASAAAAYHPAFYWVIGTAALPFAGTSALYAMRIAAALMCLLFLGLAVWATAQFSTRWPMGTLLLAASPVFIYSTIVAAPNGLEMSAGLSLWASLLAIGQVDDRSKERRLLWVAILSAVVLGTLRLLGPVFVLLIVASVVAFQWRHSGAVVRRHPRLILLGTSLVGASVGEFAWWTFGPISLATDEVGPEGPTSFDIGNLLLWPLQSVAAFPYRDQMGPLLVYAVVPGLVTIALLVALRLGTRGERVVLLATLATALILPVAFTLATMEMTGVIWQGRYGLPYAVGFVLLSGVIVGRHIGLESVPWSLTVPAMAAYVGVVVACLLKVRDVEFYGNAASAADRAWHVPETAYIVVLVAVAMLGPTLVLSGARRRLPPGPAPAESRT